MTYLRRVIGLGIFAASLAAPVLSAPVLAADVKRLPLVGSDFPILAAVTIPAGTDTIFLSGAMGLPAPDKSAKPGTPLPYTDTKTQTIAALTAIKGTLARLNLGVGSIVKMTVFLAGDAKLGGKMDFAGMMAGYKMFFGTKEQPNLPTRSAVQVAALASPAGLVEIEVVAVKPH